MTLNRLMIIDVSKSLIVPALSNKQMSGETFAFRRLKPPFLLARVHHRDGRLSFVSGINGGRMRRLPCVIVLSGLLLWSPAAYAAPVTWTIVDASFDAASGGGTVTGFFVWDALTKVLSDWSITVNAGTANDTRFPADPTSFSAFTYDTTSSIGCGFPAGPFTGQCSGGAFNGIVVSQVYATPLNGVYGRTLSLGFTTPLTDAGGVATIDASGNYLAYEAFSSPSGCVANKTCNEREFAAGSVVGTPEPSTLLCLGTGLLTLVRSRRKRVAQ